MAGFRIFQSRAEIQYNPICQSLNTSNAGNDGNEDDNMTMMITSYFPYLHSGSEEDST